METSLSGGLGWSLLPFERCTPFYLWFSARPNWPAHTRERSGNACVRWLAAVRCGERGSVRGTCERKRRGSPRKGAFGVAPCSPRPGPACCRNPTEWGRGTHNGRRHPSPPATGVELAQRRWYPASSVAGAAPPFSRLPPSHAEDGRKPQVMTTGPLSWARPAAVAVQRMNAF